MYHFVVKRLLCITDHDFISCKTNKKWQYKTEQENSAYCTYEYVVPACVLNHFIHTEAGIVLNLFLNFEQK